MRENYKIPRWHLPPWLCQKISLILLLFSVKNDQYLIGNRNPTLNLASMDIGLSASIPVEKSFNQIQQTAQLSEYEEQQKQLVQSQSRGMSIG